MSLANSLLTAGLIATFEARVPSSPATAEACSPGSMLEYVPVVSRVLECPKCSETTFEFTFNFISSVAWVCLRSCSLTPLSPALLAMRREVCVTESGLMGLLSG